VQHQADGLREREKSKSALPRYLPRDGFSCCGLGPIRVLNVEVLAQGFNEALVSLTPHFQGVRGWEATDHTAKQN
jgi:hypothetical protein